MRASHEMRAPLNGCRQALVGHVACSMKKSSAILPNVFYAKTNCFTAGGGECEAHATALTSSFFVARVT